MVRIVPAAAFLLLLLPSFAQALDVEGKAYAGIFDKYLWRGLNLSAGRAVIQGGVDLSAKGFTLGLWGNSQLRNSDDYKAGEVTEVDFTVDYTFTVGELLSLSAGNCFQVLSGMADTSEAYVRAVLEVPLQPAIAMYYDWDQAQEKGLFYALSVGHTFSPSEWVQMQALSSVSYNERSDYLVGNYSDWHTAEFSITADCRISEHVTVTPSLLYSIPISGAAREVTDDYWLSGVTLSLAF